APSGADKTVTTNEDAPYSFSISDFGFSDPNDSQPNSFQAVRISSLPASSSLLLNGSPVQAGDFILASQIGGLSFTPATNANDGNSVRPQFTFQVQDNGGTANGGADLDPIPKTVTISVTSVNDAPNGSDQTIAMLRCAGASYIFSPTDFGYSDPYDSPPNIL